MARQAKALTETRIDKLVSEANARLKTARVGLSIYRRGNFLNLRGTFPPGRPGSKSKKDRPHQQIVPLKTYVNPAGIQHAEKVAMEWGSLLAQQRFTWEIAIPHDEDSADSFETCGHWIDLFKRHIMRDAMKAKTSAEAELKWKENYWYPALGRLDWNAKLDAEAIIKGVHKTKPNTRSRQIACQRLTKFARFADVDVDLAQYVGSYKQSSVKRDIPNRKVIEASIDAMPRDGAPNSPRWQWIAGMIATYGLRDHEAFQCELYDDEGILYARVHDGKTEFREGIPPMHQEWVERWKLSEARPPKLKVAANKVYGTRVSRAFSRYEMPFKPYALRHAYAIRGSLEYGFPVAVMAKWLGHDPNVFLSIYQRHITVAQGKDAYRQKMAELQA